MLMFVLLLAAFITIAIEFVLTKSLMALGVALFVLAFVVDNWPG
jgi:hypothetical protein